MNVFFLLQICARVQRKCQATVCAESWAEGVGCEGGARGHYLLQHKPAAVPPHWQTAAGFLLSRHWNSGWHHTSALVSTVYSCMCIFMVPWGFRDHLKVILLPDDVMSKFQLMFFFFFFNLDLVATRSDILLSLCWDVTKVNCSINLAILLGKRLVYGPSGCESRSSRRGKGFLQCQFTLEGYITDEAGIWGEMEEFY